VIRKANEVNQTEKYRGVIYGVPGIRKSTTGLSAPAPLIVDTDRGWSRIDVRFRRGGYIQPETYDGLLSDLTQENCQEYKTIVFDTGGALLELMKPYVIKQSSKNGQKDGVTLSMAGYGAVGREFARLVDYCFSTLDKNVLVIFHAKEEQDGETKVYRLDIEGATKNNIWKNMDFGCFMEMRGTKYILGFSPTERYYAKSSRGIVGEIELPNVTSAENNTFISDLFAKFKQINKDELLLVEQYNKLMEKVRALIEKVIDCKTVNDAVQEIKSYDHCFASKTEAWVLLSTKAEQLNLGYDKASQLFKDKACLF